MRISWSVCVLVQSLPIFQSRVLLFLRSKNMRQYTHIIFIMQRQLQPFVWQRYASRQHQDIHIDLVNVLRDCLWKSPVGRVMVVLARLWPCLFSSNLLYREDKADSLEVVRHRSIPGYRGVINFTSWSSFMSFSFSFDFLYSLPSVGGLYYLAIVIHRVRLRS